MHRSVPLWAVLLGLIFGALAALFLAFAVKSTLAGSDRTGIFGVAAVEIASFPTIAKDVVQELGSRVTGDYEDLAIRVQRDQIVERLELAPVATRSGVDLPGLQINPPGRSIYPGWRVITGAFRLNGSIQNAALLMSAEREIVHYWSLTEVPGKTVSPASRYRKLVHGLDVLPDGSVIATFDGGVSLQRVSACGERLWSIEGKYNHSVELNDHGRSVWTLGTDDALVEVAVADGVVLRTITIQDIIDANPQTDVLELRREHSNALGLNSKSTSGRWFNDPHHLNDVEPLSKAMAESFEHFNAGDLLISARSLNLVMVLDPMTLQIKWWQIGLTQRQHDPDWMPDGSLSVLNNRMSRDYSEIVRLVPHTQQKLVTLDGRQHDFYTRIRGKHQWLADGSLIVASAQQGRIFELDSRGDKVLEIFNTRPGDPLSDYVVTDMKWLPANYFKPGAKTCLPIE